MPIPVTFSHAEVAEILSALVSRKDSLRANARELSRSGVHSCGTLKDAIDRALAVSYRCQNLAELASIKLARARAEVDGTPLPEGRIVIVGPDAAFIVGPEETRVEIPTPPAGDPAVPPIVPEN